MGIKGLLPALKEIQERKHISDYKGLTVAIDSYCWLHKAVYHLNFSLNSQQCKCNKGQNKQVDSANDLKNIKCDCKQNLNENRVGDIHPKN